MCKWSAIAVLISVVCRADGSFRSLKEFELQTLKPFRERDAKAQREFR